MFFHYLFIMYFILCPDRKNINLPTYLTSYNSVFPYMPRAAVFSKITFNLVSHEKHITTNHSYICISINLQQRYIYELFQ